jgi:hypothetical protein
MTSMPLPLSIKASAQRKIVFDPPQYIVEGIGQVLSAHALIEHFVQHLLYDLMVAHAHVGRIAIGRRDPAVHFKSIRRLMGAWNVAVPMNLEEFESEIRRHTRERNALAHGVWVFSPNGEIALSRTEGYYDTEEGERDAAILPDWFVPPSDWFSNLRNKMMETTQKVRDLKTIIWPSLPPLPDISRWE